MLFYESPRLSRDLDLLAFPTQIPRPEKIEGVVRSSIQSIAETLGLGQLEFRKDIESPGFVKQWVLANHRALFSIDLTSIGGIVLKTQIVKKAIANAPEKIVATPNATYLLFQKCETFLDRRHVKARYQSCSFIGSGRNRNELDNYPHRRSTKQLHRAHRTFSSRTQAL